MSSEDDKVERIIEMSNPLSVVEVSQGRCIREGEVRARARGVDDYVVRRSLTITCIDELNMYIASRIDNPPSMSDLITFARSIGVTSIDAVYKYVSRLCRAGLVALKFRCGIKHRCEPVPGCPIEQVVPTQLGYMYALATAALSNTPTAEALKPIAQRNGVTPTSAVFIRQLIISEPNTAKQTIKLLLANKQGNVKT